MERADTYRSTLSCLVNIVKVGLRSFQAQLQSTPLFRPCLFERQRSCACTTQTKMLSEFETAQLENRDAHRMFSMASAGFSGDSRIAAAKATARRFTSRCEIGSAEFEAWAWIRRQTKQVLLGFAFVLMNQLISSDVLTGMAGK